MATARPWTVLKHDPLTKHEDNLWSVVGDLPGMALRRRMTLVRMADGRVVVHNAIAVDEGTLAQIEAWGAPWVLIVPNGWHRLDASAWKDRFPRSTVLCAEGATASVKKQVAVDGAYESFAGDASVRFETLGGLAKVEGVMIVTSGERVTLVFNDALFNQPHLPGFAGWMLRYVTDSTGGPKLTRIGRWFMLKDRAAFVAHLLRLAETPGLARLVPGHGDLVERDAAATLRGVANALG